MQNPNPQILPPLRPSDVEVLPDPVRRWLPATAAQKAALDSEADILLLGGAAGSLKTSSMLVDLIQERDYPRMRSYFFRRTYKELEGGDSAIDQSLQLFPQTGATYNATSHTWRWPSGAEFYFRHCQYEKDVYGYQGHAMSAGAVDESTHWEEKLIRYLISRNRSTDSGLKVRWRLGTNPGNVGHKWHMKLFFGGVCPHCEPRKAPPQNTLIWDARWPSDGTPLADPDTGEKMSIAYILSYVRDHNLLGSQYVAKLKMQSANTAKALLEGCWKIFEGQFFDVWDYERMTVPRKSLNDAWWWPRWVASDYGFSGSSPAAGLFIQSPPSSMFPRGQVILADEIGGHDMQDKSTKPFAQAIVDKWVAQRDDQQRIVVPERRWQPWYLSPDAFNDRGGMFTLAGQMNEVLDKYGLYFQKARNDRSGGWMKMYNALRDGEFLICKECVKSIEGIESRIVDPDRENDLFKVAGDELDDFVDMDRYGYYSWATSQEAHMPARERMNEQLQAAWSRDPTAAMVKLPSMMQEVRPEGQSTVYGGSARARMNQARHRRLP